MELCRIDIYKIFSVSKIIYNNNMMIALKSFFVATDVALIASTGRLFHRTYLQ
jgi:hypothetical protein